MAAEVPELEKRSLGLAPRVKKSRLTLRIWRFPVPVTAHHSFIAGSSESGGLSEKLETVIPYDPDRTTLARLRIPIEVENHNGMNRRTSLYQELLSVMLACDNPHAWPSATALTFRFGMWPHADYEDPDLTPEIIPKAAEGDLVAKWITDPLKTDLILVPQVHVDRDDVCTLIQVADRPPKKSPEGREEPPGGDQPHPAPAPAPADAPTCTF